MFPQLGVMEMIVVMGVAVLLFGSRLPEVGRSLGKGIIEFKKGLRGWRTSWTSPEAPRPRAGPKSAPAPATMPTRPSPNSRPQRLAPVPHMEYQPPAD